MEEESQQADAADLARFGYKQELRLAQTLEGQSHEWANDVDYSRVASVWAWDVGRAPRIARKLQFGMAWTNTRIPLVNEMPHGGYQQSDYAEGLGICSLEAHTRIKHVRATHD